MKKQILISLILLNSILTLNAQIYTPGSTIQGTSGNNYVGIGTATPSNNLSILVPDNATKGITITDAQGQVLNMTPSFGSNALPGIGTGSNHALTFRANSVEYMRLTTNGYVGIATTSPLSKLDVSQGLGFSFITGAENNLQTRTNSTTKVTRWGLPHYLTAEEPATIILGESNATENILRFGGGSSFGNASTKISFFTAINNTTVTGTEAMTILNNGNVGIGTTNPYYKFHVVGASFLDGSVYTGGTIRALNSGSYASIDAVSYSNTDWHGSRIGFSRARGAFGAGTAVVSGDIIGWFDYFGSDGANSQRAAQFSVYVDGAVSTGIVPGKFTIATANTSGVIKTRLTAYSNDNIVMATNGGNVGIGTITPTALLQLGTGSATTKEFGIQFGSDVTANLYRNASNKLNTDGWMQAQLGFIGNIVQFNTMYPTGDVDLVIETRPGTSRNVIFKTVGTTPMETMRLDANGNVGIGTTTSAYKLDVCGTIRAKEVKVDLLGGCDFVFKSDYKLMDLNELESFVKTNQHLPEIAPEKEMVENGVNMKDLQMKLLQKVEELTLYVIEQNKRIERLENENIELKKTTSNQ